MAEEEKQKAASEAAAQRLDPSLLSQLRDLKTAVDEDLLTPGYDREALFWPAHQQTRSKVFGPKTPRRSNTRKIDEEARAASWAIEKLTPHIQRMNPMPLSSQLRVPCSAKKTFTSNSLTNQI